MNREKTGIRPRRPVPDAGEGPLSEALAGRARTDVSDMRTVGRGRRGGVVSGVPPGRAPGSYSVTPPWSWEWPPPAVPPEVGAVVTGLRSEEMSWA